MTEADRREFAVLMLGIGEAFGEVVSPTKLDIYFSALADLPIDELRRAATVHVQTQKFFPRVAELREAIDGNATERADLAWVALLREVRRVGWCGVPTWTDPVLKATALGMFRDWRDLCETMPGDGPALLGMAKQFKATYAAYARRDLRENLLPPSRDEARASLKDLAKELVSRGLQAPGLPTR